MQFEHLTIINSTVKPYIPSFSFASAFARPVRPSANRNVLYGVGFLCFALAVSACKKSETAQSDDSSISTAHRSKSKATEERHSQAAVKNLFLTDRRQLEDLAEQRRQLIDKLSTSELVASIRSLNPVDHADDRVVLRGLFLALAKKDPSSVLEMLNELPGEYYKIAVIDAFPYLAKESPEILEGYVLRSDFSNEKERWMMIAACDVLGKGNPEKALSFFDEMSEEKKRSSLGTTVLKQAATVNADLVIGFLTRNRQLPYFTDHFRDVLYTVLVKDPNLALKLASSYPEVQNTQLSAGIYTSMVRANPKLALDEIPSASPEVRLEILSRRNFDNVTYFSKLFSEDPAKTMELFKGIIPSDGSSKLFDEATDHLSNLPSGPLRDASVRAFADAIRPTDPAAADRWIGSLH